MTQTVAALVTLVALGAPLGGAFSPSLGGRLVFGTAAFGVVASIAATLAVGTSTSYWPWLIAGWIAAVVVAHRISPSAARDDPLVMLAIAATAIALAPVMRAPIGWDARAIWFWHAAWLQGGGAAYAHAFVMPTVSTTHVDYPPLAPATIAAIRGIWHSGRDARMAQAATTWLSFAALAAAAWSIARVGRRRVACAAAALGFVVVALELAGSYSTNGYVDVMTAGWSAAGAVLLLGPQRDRVPSATGLLAVAACAVTKNEGAIVAVCILAIAALSATRRERVRLLAAIVPAAAWVAISSVRGARGDLVLDARHTTIAKMRDRVAPTASALGHRIGPLLAVIAVVFLVHWFALDPERRRTIWAFAAKSVGVCALYVLALSGAYLVSRHDIHWYINASATRAVFVVQFILVAMGAATVADAWGAGVSPSVPDDDTRHDQPLAATR